MNFKKLLIDVFGTALGFGFANHLRVKMLTSVSIAGEAKGNTTFNLSRTTS